MACGVQPGGAATGRGCGGTASPRYHTLGLWWHKRAALPQAEGVVAQAGAAAKAQCALPQLPGPSLGPAPTATLAAQLLASLSDLVSQSPVSTIQVWSSPRWTGNLIPLFMLYVFRDLYASHEQPSGPSGVDQKAAATPSHLLVLRLALAHRMVAKCLHFFGSAHSLRLRLRNRPM